MVQNGLFVRRLNSLFSLGFGLVAVFLVGSLGFGVVTEDIVVWLVLPGLSSPESENMLFHKQTMIQTGTRKT